MMNNDEQKSHSVWNGLGIMGLVMLLCFQGFSDFCLNFVGKLRVVE